MSWSNTLPELAGVTPAAMDPARIEAAMRAGYAAGHEAGQHDGYAAGYAAGQEAGRAALDGACRRLSAALSALNAQLDRLDAAQAANRAAFEAASVDTALTIAEAILERELAVAADPGRDAIVRALAAAPVGAASASVRLHPVDAEHLGTIHDLAPGVDVTVVADPAVEPGGCHLSIADTHVDATVSAALARVREVLAT